MIKSTNGGTNWAHLQNPNIASADLRADAITFDSAGPVYAGGSGTPNVAKSNDGGASWAKKNTGLPDPPPEVRALLINPAPSEIHPRRNV